MMQQPTNLVCSISGTTISATWNAVPKATQYRFHVYKNLVHINGEQYTTGTTSSYIDSSMKVGDVYEVHVRVYLPSQSPSTISQCTGYQPPSTKWKCTDPATNTCSSGTDSTYTYPDEATCKTSPGCVMTKPVPYINIDINTILLILIALLVIYWLFFKK